MTEKSKWNTPISELTDDEKLSLAPWDLFLMLPRLLWAAFVIVHCWGWFAVPMGAPEITMAHAVGLDVLVTVITVQPQNIHESFSAKIFRWSSWPAILLLFGWLAQAAMTAGY